MQMICDPAGLLYEVLNHGRMPTASGVPCGLGASFEQGGQRLTLGGG
jgi:hypothetical protein